MDFRDFWSDVWPSRESVKQVRTLKKCSAVFRNVINTLLNFYDDPLCSFPKLAFKRAQIFEKKKDLEMSEKSEIFRRIFEIFGRMCDLLEGVQSKHAP